MPSSGVWWYCKPCFCIVRVGLAFMHVSLKKKASNILKNILKKQGSVTAKSKVTLTEVQLRQIVSQCYWHVCMSLCMYLSVEHTFPCIYLLTHMSESQEDAGCFSTALCHAILSTSSLGKHWGFCIPILFDLNHSLPHVSENRKDAASHYIHKNLTCKTCF